MAIPNRLEYAKVITGKPRKARLVWKICTNGLGALCSGGIVAIIGYFAVTAAAALAVSYELEAVKTLIYSVLFLLPFAFLMFWGIAEVVRAVYELRQSRQPHPDRVESKDEPVAS